jgi:hypothetical protein
MKRMDDQIVEFLVSLPVAWHDRIVNE